MCCLCLYFGMWCQLQLLQRLLVLVPPGVRQQVALGDDYTLQANPVLCWGPKQAFQPAMWRNYT